HEFQCGGDKQHQSLPSVIQKAKNTTTLTLRHDHLDLPIIPDSSTLLFGSVGVADISAVNTR
ncbi:hypothetical protein QZQ41_25440, partial [Serratia marcescens]|uniref:hypothetical protein n=1 Tax=Serratia marcescens TaxID=615 RepID=UPI001C649113